MKKKQNNIATVFNSKDEAFEFLVRKSQEEELKAFWSNELELLPDPPLKKSTRIIRIVKKASKIAAIMIVILGSFYWITLPESEVGKIAANMVEETKIAYMPELTTRGVETVENPEVNLLLLADLDKAMESGEYENAITIFSSIEQKGSLSLEEQFFYAYSILKSENADYERCTQLLQQVISNEDKYYLESLWLQGLVYLEVQERTKAIKTLTELKNKSTYQYKNVNALLEKLQD